MEESESIVSAEFAYMNVGLQVTEKNEKVIIRRWHSPTQCYYNEDLQLLTNLTVYWIPAIKDVKPRKVSW